MIRIKLAYPKIGNRLFQLAAAIGLANKYNDTVAFPEWYYSKYFMGDFSNLDDGSPHTNVYQEPEFKYNAIAYSKNVSLEGYFQSYKYFEHCTKLIRDTFTLRIVESNINVPDNTAFIHVRRGDYVGLQDFHPLKTFTNYYSKAIDVIDSFSPSGYFIFSDDIQAVKDEFPSRSDFYFVEGGDEISDLYLMTQCKHAIIGNSSYGYWGAMLRKNRDGRTLYPKEYFGPALKQHNICDLAPRDWSKI